VIGYRGNKRVRVGRRGSVGAMESLEVRSLLSATTLSANPALATGQPEIVPNELLIQFKPGATGAAMAAAHAGMNLRVEETIHTSVMQATGAGPLQRVTLGNGVAMKQAVDALSRNPMVSFVEPNYVYRTALTPNDTYYTNGGLWGMYGSDSPIAAGPAGTTNTWGSNAEQAWNNNVTGSRSIVVGIIDEGIQTTHPDLNDNIWVNPYEVAGDGVDNDGNGYVDDINGWDFFHNDNTVYDTGEDAHGTHVAGTIGGEGNNGTGVVGVNWAVTMISTKFLGPTGGSTAGAMKALDYLTDLKNRHGINLVASNNSWGGGGYSQTLHDAIIRAAKKDILFVAAAGNSTTNNDTTASYPSNYNTSVGTSTQTAASYDSVIAVASITNTGAISSFSSYGATTVDIGAPGSSITSSVPVSTYATYNGTSMATPHVTGAVALYASAQGTTISAETIRTAILSSAAPTASLTGKTVTGGRLDVYEAIRKLSFMELDKTVYGLTQVAGISLSNAAANVNTGVADTVVVSIRSTTEATPISVTLTETGVSTGQFTGTIQLGSGTPIADSVLQVSHNDTITVQYSALNLSDTATVDGLAPAISGINANAAATTATITWTTSELSAAQVQYGLSPGALNQTWNGSQTAASHSAGLSGLAAATTYYYQIGSLDAAGNAGSSAILSFTTQNPAPILFVDDDHGATFERFFTAALASNSLTFDTWNVFSGGTLPTAQDLLRYRVVIWNTGSDYGSVGAGLSAAEQSAISGYLSAGGRIFISGQDVLYNGVAADFQTNFLKVASYTNDVSTAAHTEAGVTESPISSGMSLSVAAPADFGSLYVDSVAPAAGAVGLLQHGVTTAAAPFSGVSYRGDYATGGFGMVFSTVPFESLSTTVAAPNNQTAFLKRTIDFLTATATVGINVSSPAPATATTEAGGQVSFTVVLASKPAADVTIPIQSSDLTEGTVSATSLVFTPLNWSTPQTVTVTGVNDAVDDGNVGYTIVLGAAVSGDVAYDGLNAADVALSNTDDDTAGVTVSAPTGISTTESGSTVTFTVRLNSEPLADVTIPVSSTDTTEGVVSTASLVFTSANWNVAQTVTVTGVDDTIFDGNIAYTISIAAAASSDTLYNGINPADIGLTNIDNESTPATKFYVVDDATVNRTFEYDANGAPIENYLTNAGNAAPRGIATVIAGDKLWVVDANRNVYIYNNSGVLLGSWLAGSLANNATVEGIATDGLNIWIVDARSDKVFYYAAAASRLSGTQTATTSFALAAGNASSKDIVFGSQAGVNYLWTVNNTASLDRVFRYSLNTSGIATTVTSWTISTQNASPTGIALDPSNTAMDIWISDSGTDSVYRYANARSLTTPVLTSSFALSATNANPQGLADPPTEAAEPLMSGYRRATAATPAILSVPARTTGGSSVFATGQQPANENSAAFSRTETALNSGTSVNRAGKSAEAVAHRNRLGFTLSRVAQKPAAKTPDKAVTSDAESIDGLFSQLSDNQLFWLDHRN
jgi:subtilisin family serine protease